MANVMLAFVGDVMLGRGVNVEIGHRAPEYFWGDTLPVLRSADAVIANLECAITNHTQSWSKSPKVFHFRAGPHAVDVLRAAGVRCVSLANNHILDYEEQGLLDTLEHLDAAGIHHAGAGRNLVEATAPAVFEAGGLRVGVVAFTDNEPLFAAGANQPGANYIDINTTPTTLSLMNSAIENAREAGADLVVLSLHWGPNMVPRPPFHFQAFAIAMTHMGAHVVYGHSAHVVQAVQAHGHGLVMYDTGDFVDDYAVDPEMHNDWSFVFLVDADDEGPLRLRMLPVKLGFARVDLATGSAFEAIRGRMRALCLETGAPVVETSEGLLLEIR